MISCIGLNSLVLDTENKMRKIIENPEVGNMYFLYHSYGCQLLMKDISEMPWFAPIFKKAQMVASYFHKADNQLSILRMYQLRREQKRIFFITLSYLTRWVTQVGLIENLLRSQMALCLWPVHDSNIPDADEVRGLNLDAVMTHQFWNDLSNVLLVMEVIHEQ